jgi:CubicO group peptidase (beta-lactamase class C family)
MLGYIISKASGKPYGQFITENVFTPLNMNATYWEFTKVPSNQLALGHRWINNKWQKEPLLHHGSWGAMGGLMTSLEDFVKYVALHQSAWPVRNDPEMKISKRSALREMHQPSRFNTLNASYKYPSGRACALALAYGYGLRWTKDCEGRVTVGHSGGLPGFGSNWAMLPDYGIAVISFANATYAPASVINTTVLDTILAISKIQKMQLTPSAILKERKDQLARFLPDWNNAEKSGLFAENFFLDFPIPSLKRDASTLFQKAGKIVRIHEIVPENNLRGSFIIEGEKGNIQVYFTLTPEKNPMIQDYRIIEVKK